MRSASLTFVSSSASIAITAAIASVLIRSILSNDVRRARISCGVSAGRRHPVSQQRVKVPGPTRVVRCSACQRTFVGAFVLLRFVDLVHKLVDPDLAFRITSTQGPFVELPDAGLGDLLDERPPLRHLPVRDLPSRKAAQLLRRRRRTPPSCTTTVASGRSPHRSSGTPTTAASMHLGVRHEGVLEVDRADPLAAGLDDVLGPVGQREEAVRRQRADVAGPQPAVVELGRLGASASVPSVVVATRRSMGPDLQLADALAVPRLLSPSGPTSRASTPARPALGVAVAPVLLGGLARPARGTAGSPAGTSRSCPRRG